LTIIIKFSRTNEEGFDLNLLAVLVAGVLVNSGTSRSELTKLTISRKSQQAVSTYRGGNYCGPGWGFTYKDILEGNIRNMPDAIDAIDEACKAHDYCYEENGYFAQGCNLVLSYDLVQVITDEQSSSQQRIDATIMAAIFFIESQTIDLGILAKKEIVGIRNRIFGHLVHAHGTVESAIKRELNLRGARLH